MRTSQIFLWKLWEKNKFLNAQYFDNDDTGWKGRSLTMDDFSNPSRFHSRNRYFFYIFLHICQII